MSSVILGATSEELITETARQFGYDRTGSDIQVALSASLDLLLDQGILVCDTDGIVRPSLDSSSTVPTPNTASESPSGLSAAIEIARRHRLKVIDKTDNGGALWIVGGPELKQLLQPLGFKFAEKGGRATDGRAAWWAK